MDIDIKNLRTHCKKLRLLYVEDDERARESTLKLLKRFFDDITVAEDGEDGLRLFTQGDFDLIISDINMPKMNGIEMLKEIRKISKDVPFLLLSAYAESDYFTESISLGVSYFIIKPVQEQQFREALSNVVQTIEFKELSKQYKEKLESELEKRTKEIVYKLYNDELTNLKSRYAFFEDKKSYKQAVVYLVDIDKFHVINDIFGHEIGNKVLKDFGMIVKTFAKNFGANSYRLSGDEFTLMKEEDHLDIEANEDILKKLFELIKNTEFNYDNESIKPNVRIGIAFGNKYLYEHASIALDYAKAHKKDYFFYSSENDRTVEQKRMIEERYTIQSAIDNEGIVAVYQPIVDTNGNISKYETLMRIKNSNNDELIAPIYFLSTAIKTGLYDTLSINVIKQGLELTKNTQHALSFNFTYRDIINTKFLDEIETFFKEIPEVGSRVVFEITENESMDSYEVVKNFINRFRNYGVRIAIDDFGSGFSNFNYILEMEPDFLKIDGSLIKDIDTNEKSLALTEGIINFSNRLGINIIAEFVHNEKIFLMLKDLGVHEFQGFYFSEPLTVEKL